jgi:hypothetical protein
VFTRHPLIVALIRPDATKHDFRQTDSGFRLSPPVTLGLSSA